MVKKLTRKSEKSPKADAPARLLTSAELRAELDVSRVTLTDWAHKGMPVAKQPGVGKRNLYDLAAVKAWLAGANLHQPKDLESPRTRSDADLALVLQKIRKERASADKAELGLQTRRGQLLEREEVQAGRLWRISSVTQALEAMPGKLAPELVGRDARAIQARLADEVRAIREVFAREDKASG